MQLTIKLNVEFISFVVSTVSPVCREGGNNPVFLLMLLYCATVYMTSNTKWLQNKRLFSEGEGSGGLGCK